MDLRNALNNRLETVIKVRELLHDNAELAYKECKTRDIIINFLKDLGLDIKTAARTGVVGIMNDGDECIAIRCDMDALPVNGVSHACGHDYHMAVVLGTAMVLKDLRFEKCVKFIFQPAEEGVGGALPMIDEGVLENPRVKYVLGFHVWPMVDVGKIEVKGGASMASADDFYIKFRGSGGHAAMPYLCKNPLYPAIDFVQTITAKSKMENDPLNPHVVTISSINGGSAPNVIPDEVEVMGTVRTFDDRLRHKLYDDIKSISGLCAQKYGCDAKLNYIFQYPPLINDEKLAESFAACSKKVLGKGNVLPLKETFAAEDFSYFAERVPSVHFRLGISDGIKGMHPLHSSEFDASDDAIYHGINVLTNFILSI